MALESLPKIAPALFSAEQDLIQIYNKKSDTVGTINASYIGGSTPPSGVSGAIQFSNGSAFASDSANLFWDDTNNRLGIGTNAPATALDIQGADNTFLARFDTVSGDFKIKPFLNATYGTYIESRYADGRFMPLSIGASRLFAFTPVSIGTDSTSAMLQVQGSGSTNATTSLLVKNSDGTTLMSIADNGAISIGASNITTFSGTVQNLTGPLQALNFQSTNSPFNFGVESVYSILGTTPVVTSGQRDGFLGQFTFAPTSGTAILNVLNASPTINQTGGANGITRGLYINPTLTAAADFRAIEATQGNVLLATTSGNVGIGTTNPTARLRVISADTNGIAEFFQNGNTAAPLHLTRYGGNVPINLNTSGGTSTSPVPVGDNIQMSRITTNTYNGTAFANSARIEVLTKGIQSATNYGSVMRFLTTPENATSMNEVMSLTSDGNVQIGIGYLVAGGAKLGIKGSGSTGATTSLLVQNSLGTQLMRVYDDGSVNIGTTNGAVSLNLGYNNQFYQNQLNFYSAATNIRGMNAGGQGLIISKNTGTTDLYPSAILAIDSTTQGFLPPRMTDAQIRIIATPAVGLMAYNTDLDCPVFYSAAGWRKVSHSVM